jgi:hypothetical protein
MPRTLGTAPLGGNAALRADTAQLKPDNGALSGKF